MGEWSHTGGTSIPICGLRPYSIHPHFLEEDTPLSRLPSPNEHVNYPKYLHFDIDGRNLPHQLSHVQRAFIYKVVIKDATFSKARVHRQNGLLVSPSTSTLFAVRNISKQTSNCNSSTRNAMTGQFSSYALLCTSLWASHTMILTCFQASSFQFYLNDQIY